MISNYQKIQNLVSEISEIKKQYDEERSKDRFNIFYALHKQHDEVNLHSRFISYLLAKDSGHDKEDIFARRFFEVIYDDKNKSPESFFENYEVIPNEYNKTEFEEIDILLVNRKLSHAVIIENKIFAKDSNHTGKDIGYNGQLERYYNTLIKSEKYISENKTELAKYTCENIDVFYLSLNPPNEESFNFSKGNIPENVCVKRLSYEYTIIPWLKNCLKEINDKNESFLKKIINQYLILVKNMTNTNMPRKEREALKEVFSTDLETSKYIIDNFKHIKWHTVDDFLICLARKIEQRGYKNVSLYPKSDNERANLITDLTHHNKNINIGVTFQDSKEKYYISTLNNLSWGTIEPEKRWENFKSNELENIRFSEFSNENTYNLINEENMKSVVNLIVEEITIANKS